ncbi:hypothetical protein [Streptomyces sp. NPDC017435]|uniref:hypothetical protein n=1 Tax=Streptomyces sp. NPDC017435 TaxID=3364995 RepID=UPI0037ACBB5F
MAEPAAAPVVCSLVSVFIPVHPGAQEFGDLQPRQHPTVYRESAVAVAIVLLTIALVLVTALLAAAGAGKLARIDGATYSAALTRAAITFATAITRRRHQPACGLP